MRNLLVVVDMQNDFIDGSLGTKEAVAIVDNVIAEIAKYDTKDIFATRVGQSRGAIKAMREILKWSGFKVVSAIELGGTTTLP